jgi:5'-nucleotidase / UDP-sugar diphosphatase
MVNGITAQSNTGVNKETRAQIFYFNDLHGHVNGAERIATAADMFTSSTNPQIAQFKLSAGDIFIGHNEKKGDLLVEFLNLINVDAAVFGNHEFDLAGALSEHIKKFRAKFVSTNLNVSQSNKLYDNVKSGEIVKSQVIEKNGEKYGILGFLPFDFMKRINAGAQKACEGISIDDFAKIKEDAQKEIEKFQKQGINKIIAISHLGYDNDKNLAQSVSGIDIIIGGHSHNKIDGIASGFNYFNSPSGEPVLITQAEQNGKYYGVADVVFDSLGRIKNASNKLNETSQVPESLMVKYFENVYIGQPQVIGNVEKGSRQILESELTESPSASLVADAVRKKSGAQIVFTNTGGIKGEIKSGPLIDRDIQESMPYYNSVEMYKFSEKDIIGALNGSIQACINPPHRIGSLQVSGMHYTIGKDKKVKDVFVENPDKTLTQLNSENPADDRYFTVAYNEYFQGGPEGVEMLNAPDKVIKKFEWSDTDATIEYIKSLNRPISLVPEGRIKIE